MNSEAVVDNEAAGAGAQEPRAVLVGLLGRGIQLSRSPAMHEAEGAAQGINYQYKLFDTAGMAPDVDIEDILKSAETCGFAGLNVTFPYKVAIIEHLDELSDAARALGAVNTVVFRDGRRRGHNTDWWGFAESFRRNMAGAKCDAVLQIGAGGAGAAVAHALLEQGVGELRIFDRDPEKSGALEQRINSSAAHGRARAVSTLEEGLDGAVDGLVNASPVGMASMPGTPVPAGAILPTMWVADIVYFPLETELLRIAREKGCHVLPGSGMAVFQAVRAFEHFTGLVPDSDRMEAAFNRFDSKDRA